MKCLEPGTTGLGTSFIAWLVHVAIIRPAVIPSSATGVAHRHPHAHSRSVRGQLSSPPQTPPLNGQSRLKVDSLAQLAQPPISILNGISIAIIYCSVLQHSPVKSRFSNSKGAQGMEGWPNGRLQCVIVQRQGLMAQSTRCPIGESWTNHEPGGGVATGYHELHVWGLVGRDLDVPCRRELGRSRREGAV